MEDLALRAFIEFTEPAPVGRPVESRPQTYSWREARGDGLLIDSCFGWYTSTREEAGRPTSRRAYVKVRIDGDPTGFAAETHGLVDFLGQEWRLEDLVALPSGERNVGATSGGSPTHVLVMQTVWGPSTDQPMVDLMTEAAATGMAQAQLEAILRSGKFAGHASPVEMALYAAQAQEELAATLTAEARAATSAQLNALEAAGYHIVKPA